MCCSVLVMLFLLLSIAYKTLILIGEIVTILVSECNQYLYALRLNVEEMKKMD